ncbi:MAG: PQQ-binding-like beta-propeller repeat protein [Armatimonadetes bacterium]|nr:PQQ-binding-like beta-propeller repeat protein [Armatimonadota bacterium]
MTSSATTRLAAILLLSGGVFLSFPSPSTAKPVRGWLNWRGPGQNGTSLESHLPDSWTPGGKNDLWSLNLAGRGTPVIANGKLYTLGYEGEGPDLQELLVCLNAETGKKLWEKRFSDFLSDIVYSRYSIGSPVVDPDTGNVCILTSTGIIACFTGGGKLLWQHSMMEEYGRLTFPNGRTGAPVIDRDLVLVRGITSNWGAHGAGADRFYAFDKRTGDLVWSSQPGTVPPKDSSFSTLILERRKGKQVFYCGTGCGNVVCVNASTGQPLWRYRVSQGGVNSSVVLYKDSLIAIHGDENTDSSEMGRMVALKLGAEPQAGSADPVVLDRSFELWRAPLNAWSSSPVLVGNRIYQTAKTGELYCLDADTGRVLWDKKLAPDQLHASPLYADGKLYVPMQSRLFYILRPSDAGAEVLAQVQLEGNCLGAPAVWNGRVYVHTTKKLYCFGARGSNGSLPKPLPPEPRSTPGEAKALQVVPSEVLLRPGQKATLSVYAVDANGDRVRKLKAATWKKFIPPTAKVRSEMDADFNEKGELVANPLAKISAGAFEASVDELRGYLRGRVLPDLPYREDFESFQLTEQHATEKGIKFAYPPLPWIGGRFKWEVRDLGGNKVLTKTIDNIFFQRAFTFLGHPDMHDYTVEADVRSEGNRRNMSLVGVINQRYVINLVGNQQELEVVSNQERIKVGVPFKWSPDTWYHLKSRVDLAPDGSGIVRAKAWKKGDPEPEAWTIEVPHKHAHTCGSPGVYGFALQSQFRVFIDNIVVTPNR